MGLTTAALVHQQSRAHPSAQRACEIRYPSSQGGTASTGWAGKMNIRQAVPTHTVQSDLGRQTWLQARFRDGGGLSAPTCFPQQGHRNPPRGGSKGSICGAMCGTTTDPIDSSCCTECGAYYALGVSSQETHQILKDTVKGNRGCFACGGTDKANGVYGSGTVVMREYSVAPPIPGMQPPSQTRTQLRVVQPPPAVKTITVPPRKSYAYSTAELIKKTNIGYDANLAIRSCGTRNGCTGDCTCQCAQCCQSNTPCKPGNDWYQGVCPGGMTGHGTGCTTGLDCGPSTGPCACQSWTYKRRNGQYGVTGGVDASLLTARTAQLTRDAARCQNEACPGIMPGHKECFCQGNGEEGTPGCVPRGVGLLAGTRGQIRRVPPPLVQPKRRGRNGR